MRQRGARQQRIGSTWNMQDFVGLNLVRGHVSPVPAQALACRPSVLPSVAGL